MDRKACLTMTQTIFLAKFTATFCCEGWTHYSLLVGGVACLVVPLCSSMWQLMLTSTLYSFGPATIWGLLAALLANRFGIESMASSFGFFRMGQGITNFIYPSFLGKAVQLTSAVLIHISRLYQMTTACLTHCMYTFFLAD